MDASHVPNSVTSQSVDTSVQFLNKDGSTGFIDSLFPLYMSVFNTKISIIWGYPFLGIYFLQVLWTCVWPWSKYMIGFEDMPILRWIYQILFMRICPSSDNDYIILAGIIMIPNIIIMFLMAYQLAYYKVNRKFVQILNVPLRLYFETLMIATNMPAMIGTYETAIIMLKGRFSAKLCAACILYAISFIFEYSSFIFIQNLISRSVYFTKGPLTNFDPDIMTYTILTNVVAYFLYFLLLLFEDWAPLVAIFLHCVVYVYLFLYMFNYQPFIDVLFESMGVGWFLGVCVGDALAFVSYFINRPMHYVPLLGALIVYSCFTGVDMVYVLISRKKIFDKLNVSFENQEQANKYFDELNFTKNELMAMLYLRIAFIQYCPSFYEMTLVNYLVDTSDKELTLSTCLQMVHYFPRETRMQNKIAKLLMKRRKLRFLNRFLLFQIDSVKSLRNFTVSNQSKLKLVELKTMSDHCEMMSRSAIDSTKLTSEFFENFAEKTRSCDALWKESILSSPNNPKFCEEYSKFLINSMCSFPAGLKLRHRQNLIEYGQVFAVDNSFKYMITAFPKYLTEGIVDFQGKIIKTAANARNHNNNQAKTTGTNSTSTNSSDNKLSSNSENQLQDLSNLDNEELDTEIEDHLGKTMMQMPKERIALDRCLRDKIPVEIKFTVHSIIFNILIVLVIYAYGWNFSRNALVDQIDGMNKIEAFSLARYYSALANLNIVLTDYTINRHMLGSFTDKLSDYSHSDDKPIIDLLDNMMNAVQKATTNASVNFNYLFNQLNNEASEGKNIYNYANSLIETDESVNVCNNGSIIQSNLMSFASMFSSIISVQRLMSGLTDLPSLPMDNDACTLFSSYGVFTDVTLEAFSSLSSFQTSGAEIVRKNFAIMEIAIPIVIFLLVLIPILVIQVMSIFSIRKIAEMIKSFDVKAKAKAKERIMIGSGTDDSRVSEYRPIQKKSTILIVILFIICIGVFIIAFFSLNITVNSNKNISYLSSWNSIASLRLALATESLMLLFFTCDYQKFEQDSPNYKSYTNKTTLMQFAMIATKLLVDMDNYLINGAQNTPGCVGFDEELDKLNIIDAQIPVDPSDPTVSYINASIHKQVEVYANFVNNALGAIKLGNDPTTEDLAIAFYLATSRMIPKMREASNRIIWLADDQLDKFSVKIYILFALLLFLLAMILIISGIYHVIRKATYKASLMIIKRFSPYDLLNNKIFARLFLKGKGDDKNEKLSMEGNIIKNANDSIFCTNINGTVEIVNNATTNLLGYTPEQLLGQSITSFFNPVDKEAIEAKIEQMRSGQSSSYYEDSYKALSDSMTEVPVHCTIIGMKKENENNVNSFVFLLSDQTNLVNQKKAAEEAKAKSEKLLYQILPRDIVVQLNRGEKDISFVVPSATIIFIDINRFSEYAANLTPQDIMANLSLYFAYIDKIAAKYNMLTKIKLIGDIYMAASGLFNPDSPPEAHAEQTVNFGLDCVYVLDEINIRLEANLQIRVGINSGGPVIAGVLGTDKPVFDIIGDPINVAARLQSTSDVNKVHISQATVDLIKGTTFEVVQRGETFLKGKGKQMTYYVTSPAPNFSTLGSKSLGSH